MNWWRFAFTLASTISMALAFIVAIFFDLSQIKNVGLMLLGVSLAILASLWAFEEHMKEILEKVK